MQAVAWSIPKSPRYLLHRCSVTNWNSCFPYLETWSTDAGATTCFRTRDVGASPAACLGTLHHQGFRRKFHNGAKFSVGNLLFRRSPKFLHPYLKLMRLDKPTGTWLLLWPCYWSIGLAADAGHWPSFYSMVLFGLGAFLMRGAGCTINDMWDKEFDKKVERTKSRPLSTGELAMSDALAFLAVELTLATIVLLQLNWHSIVLGFFAIIPVTFYPVAKRFTYWPQLVLGFTFNWGAMLGWCSIHNTCYWPIVLPLYLAGISWTMVYDTIYAHQDKVDDLVLGIKSTALKFGKETTKWLAFFSASMVGNLLVIGAISGQTLPYYAAVGLVGAHLFRQVWKLNIDSPKECFVKFKSNSYIGAMLFTGIMCGTLIK